MPARPPRSRSRRFPCRAVVAEMDHLRPRRLKIRRKMFIGGVMAVEQRRAVQTAPCSRGRNPPPEEQCDP